MTGATQAMVFVVEYYRYIVRTVSRCEARRCGRMKSKLRAAAMLLAVLILITALSGCVTKSAEELYCLPALS